jgi:hypothetical protein
LPQSVDELVNINLNIVDNHFEWVNLFIEHEIHSR